MKFLSITLLALFFYTYILADEAFYHKSYNVSELYSEALQYIDKKDYDKAIEKLEICSSTTRCAHKLAEIYGSDNEKYKDINKSAYYYNILFDLGNDKAYHNLGLLYYKNKDIENAKKYFKKSGDAKVYESFFNLGKLYELEGDEKESLNNYLLASEHNVSQADYTLGVYYYNHKDLKKSLYFFNKASKQGFKQANKALESLNAR